MMTCNFASIKADSTMKRLLPLLVLLNFILIHLSAQGDIPFITKWRTSASNESITIPINPALSYRYDIDWGDGSSQSDVTTSVSHTYAARGIYTVSIQFQFPAIYINDSGDKDKLSSIEQWGNIEWQSMNNAFYGASFMEYNATDVPDLSNVTDLTQMFRGASSFNGDIGKWQVGNVSDFTGMFHSATSFNRDISGWDVSSVEDMSSMFREATTFNQDIGSWDVDSVNAMPFMFRNASSFNQNIELWGDKVANVTDMSSMFEGASAFNQIFHSGIMIVYFQNGPSKMQLNN